MIFWLMITLGWIVGAAAHFSLCLRYKREVALRYWKLPAITLSVLWPLTLSFAPFLVLYLLVFKREHYEKVMEAGRVVVESDDES